MAPESFLGAAPATPRPLTSSGVFETYEEPASSSRDERQDLARKLVVIAALRIGLVTVSLGASFALIDLERTESISMWQYTLIASAYVVSLLYALALRFSAQVDVLAYAQVIVDNILVTWLVVMTGGNESVFSFAYVFVVLGAAMTLYRRGAVIGTLTSLLLFGTMVLMQIERIFPFLPPVKEGTAALSFFMYSIGLGLLGVLGSTLAETARARGRLLAKKVSEFEQLEELQAAILRSLPAGLMTVDGEGTVHYVNEAALTILRYRMREAIGRSLREVAPSIAEPWSVLLKQGRIPNPRDRFEGNFVRLDGSTIRLGFSFAPLSSRPEDFGLIVVFQDVTDIVRLKEAVGRAERLASIGKLAAGLAHEVRNPLASMCASIDVLRSALDPPPEMQRLMQNVVIEADRLNVLITDFLEFARPRTLDLADTDLSALVSGVVEIFKHEATLRDCEIASSLEPSLIAYVDSDALRQVIWNLARNAAQSMEGKRGRLTVITRTVEDYAEIVIRDEGRGIEEGLLQRIFDPFFTTKDGGTGLGLAIAHSIVEAHDGKVLVSSTLGEGTEFTLRFSRGAPLSYEPSPDETDPALNVTPSQFEILGGPI